MFGRFALGTAALSAIPVSATVPLEVHLGGEVITDRVMLDSIEIKDAIASRSAASFEIFDATGSYRPSAGQQVYILEHGARLFAGTIDQLRERRDLNGNHFLSITCVDWNQLTDRFYVAATYTAQNVRQIVTDIVNVQTSLGAEGVRVDEVQDGLLIDVATFNYKTVNQAFRDLAESSGFAWNIDHHKVLRFFDRASYGAPFVVDDSNPIWQSISFSRTRSRYRNRQILRAGVDLSDPLTQVFRGDNVTTQTTERRRTFTLRYPVGAVPEIRKNGSLQRVGVNGVDKDGDLTVPSGSTWPQWFYKLGDPIISQNSSVNATLNPVLTDVDVLEVAYKGQLPMLIDTSNDVEQASRASIEGGTGVYEDVEDDDAIDGRDLGSKRAERLLALYGRIPGTLRLLITRHGLAPGHVMTLTIAGLGISAVQFLVDSVQIRWRGTTAGGAEHFEYDVELIDGERLEGWADFFRDLAAQGRKTVIRQNEKVIVSRTARDTVTFSDAFTDSVNNSVTELAYTVDMFTAMLMATQSVGGDTVYGWEIGRSVMGVPRGV